MARCLSDGVCRRTRLCTFTLSTSRASPTPGGIGDGWTRPWLRPESCVGASGSWTPLRRSARSCATPGNLEAAATPVARWSSSPPTLGYEPGPPCM